MEHNALTTYENENVKFCVHCGAKIHKEAVVCVKCGRSVEPPRRASVSVTNDDTMVTVVKIFMILGCISQGWLLIPLAWCLPITISVFHKFRDGQPIGTGLKVCSMLFVSLIGGICLLCMNESSEL